MDPIISDLQRILRILGATVSIDGIFGPNTFRSLSVIASQLNADPNKLGRLLGLEYDLMIPRSAIESILSFKTKREADFIRFMLSIENQGLMNSDWVYNDNFGKHRGLAQFDAPTWESVSDVPYDEGVVDPQCTIDAAIRLFHSNEMYFTTKIGGVYTNEIAYLFHNQGASGARHYLTKGNLRWPNQSLIALETFARL